LENTKEVVAKFKKRLSVEVRRQEKIYMVENFRKGKLSEKYIVKILYKWDNRKFEKKYLRKLERN